MSQDADNILALANAGVQSLRPYEPGKPIDELEREYGINNAVKLASNENPLGASPEVFYIANTIMKDIHLYPDGNGFALKQALSRKHDVPPEYITLGNGSNDVLELIARVFLRPGVNAVFSEHAFAVYPIATQAVGADAHVAQPHPATHATAPFGYDLDSLATQVDDNTRVVLIANPNNPTGTWVGSKALKAFIDNLADHVIVVIDEAYFEYVEETDYPNAMQWVDKYPNLVVTRTFSKAYGLAGLRVGYAVSQPQVADLLNRVRQPFNVNALAQACALAALEDEDHIKKSVQSNREGMQQLIGAFQEMGLNYIPSVGNFICVNTGQQGKDIYQRLLEQGVIVRPIDNYGLPEYVRVTIGRQEENSRFISALKNVL